MAQKKITDLQLISNVTDDLNIPGDDGIQSYRATAAQFKNYILADGNVTTNKIADGNVTLAKLASAVAQALVPVGTVMAYAGDTAPAGYLLCNGSTVSRSTYANLYTLVGNRHGSGDGSTTFHLPDYRGRFLRGYDAAQGRDPDAASRTAMNTGGATGDNVGSLQGHAFQTHTHTQNAHSHTVTVYSQNAGDGHGTTSNPSGRAPSASTTGNSATSSATPAINNATASGTHSQASTNETRPVNATVNYIIKF